MRKICIITATRSEYGLLKWLMQDIKADKNFKLQLIVTGGHLLKEQGYTIDSIKSDGFKISETVDIDLDTSSQKNIAASMGRMAEMFASVFERFSPDLVIVLGDRYELLPICSTAFLMGIPIAHISGGDVTDGAIDNGVRNAVTMLSTYHFSGTLNSAENIARMRGDKKNIWVVGEPGLDALNRITLMSRTQLADNLGLDEKRKWCLMTYHSETYQSLEYNVTAVHSCLESLLEYQNLQVVMTYANTDFGGQEINRTLEDYAKKSENLIAIPSLGQLRYLSLMKQVSLVIGNSSSGIIEAPSLGVPVVNIGNRQKGRYQCKNIIQCDNDFEKIRKAVKEAFSRSSDTSDCEYWGNGHSSEQIVKVLKQEIFRENGYE